MPARHNPVPMVITPFSDETVSKIVEHVKHVRSCFDAPGNPYHDANETNNRFNRWYWHNLPLLKKLHHDPEFISLVSNHFGQPLKPSYVFLSMYGPEGVCPVHTDRPQCQFTVDMLVSSDHTDKPWPIYVNENPYVLTKPGEALAYSGTGQVHYRKPMSVDSDATKVDLAFFHFVPTDWMGRLE